MNDYNMVHFLEKLDPQQQANFLQAVISINRQFGLELAESAGIELKLNIEVFVNDKKDS